MTKNLSILALLLASLAFAGCAAAEEETDPEEQGETESNMKRSRSTDDEMRDLQRRGQEQEIHTPSNIVKSMGESQSSKARK